jgi:hypothetical protein
MLEIVRTTQRNVERWQAGNMRKRWTAAGMLVAEQQFRGIIGYSDPRQTRHRIERHHLTANHHNDTPEPVAERRGTRYRLTITIPVGSPFKVPRRFGQPPFTF